MIVTVAGLGQWLGQSFLHGKTFKIYVTVAQVSVSNETLLNFFKKILSNVSGVSACIREALRDCD